MSLNDDLKHLPEKYGPDELMFRMFETYLQHVSEGDDEKIVLEGMDLMGPDDMKVKEELCKARYDKPIEGFDMPYSFPQSVREDGKKVPFFDIPAKSIDLFMDFIFGKENGDKVKVIISQPMNAIDSAEIYRVFKKMTTRLNADVFEVIDTQFDWDGHALEYLGETIKMMAKADMVAFAPGWENARGCRIEHQICLDYDIPIAYYEDRDDENCSD